MRLAIMRHARAIRRIDDGTVGADDVHDAPVFHRTLFRFVRLQTLGVPRGDVASQSSCHGRAELGRDARLWTLKIREYRRGALKNVA